MANIGSPIGTDKFSREMWVDGEGERRVGGFFIDRIGKNPLTEDGEREREADTWRRAPRRKRRK